MAKNSVQQMEMQVFAFSDLTAGFKIIDVDGFDGSLHYLRITNGINVPVLISFDGVYSHEYIEAHETIDLDAQLCAIPSNEKSIFKNRAKVYVKNAGVNLPKGGSVVVMGFYQ